ncbi:hypothetical protein GO613_19235 [Azoarcus communis]|uniref:YqjK-like family protein n=1 Tax=Parazoarcus communis TaxID=41977 RepID=UPI0014592C99|nr:YqjK-like family protein [Parazoarcus communis]NMG50231.1 hypothetical protein [Parazoarcus communis]
MNPRLVEFALRKQRLQITAEHQRDDMMRRFDGLESTLDVVDQVRDGVAWTRQHAPLLSSLALIVVASRPRLVLGLAKRGWAGWLLYRKLRGGKPALGLIAAPLARRILEMLLDKFVARRGR